MSNSHAVEKIGIKNRYQQMLIVLAFLGFTVLLIFPLQNVLAVRPSTEIIPPSPDQFATILITTGTTANVRFDYRATDPDNNLIEFRCSWDGASYTTGQCTRISSGANTHTMVGYAERPLTAGRHTFGVKVQNNYPADPTNPTELNGPERISVPVEPTSLRTIQVNPTSTPPSLRITGATTDAGVSVPNGGFVIVPSTATATTTTPILYRYTATRDAASIFPISEFRCQFLMAGGFTYFGEYPTNSCRDMAATETRTATGWTRDGSNRHSWGMGTWLFSVQGFNSQGAFSTSPYWRITISTLDASRPPTASVYKANSYNVYATTSVPALGISNQYHTTNGQITPYDKMYIVFEGTYPTTSGQRSDLFERGVTTNFECKWDQVGPLVPCGRFNFIGTTTAGSQPVSPGYHMVQFRASNINGESANRETDLNHFDWCVRPPNSTPQNDPCLESSNVPSNYRAITPSDVRSYISASSDVSFYSAKNDTIALKDLEKFPLLNVTTGASNQNITLKELKEFPFGNKTIGPINHTIFEKDAKEFQSQNVTRGINNTIQNEMMGTNTNITNVTLGLKDYEVSNDSNASLAVAK